uniref:RxLR effector candidate protein n=1 Tax=Hyaloperonospora arabidopsidis (strain Emoy2) TaxID=559515 RepID=M4B3S0_HYAAE
MAPSTLIVYFLLLSTARSSLTNAQRIPRRPPGFTLGSGSADAGVQLEAYINLLTKSADGTVVSGQQVCLPWVEEAGRAV